MTSNKGLSPAMADVVRAVLLATTFVTPSLLRVEAGDSHDPEHATHTSLHTFGLGLFLFARRY